MLSLLDCPKLNPLIEFGLLPCISALPTTIGSAVYIFEATMIFDFLHLFANVFSYISTFSLLNCCGPTMGKAKTQFTDWVGHPTLHLCLTNSNTQEQVYFWYESWYCSPDLLTVFYFIWFYFDEILTVPSWQRRKLSPQTEFVHLLLSTLCHHLEAAVGIFLGWVFTVFTFFGNVF